MICIVCTSAYLGNRMADALRRRGEQVCTYTENIRKKSGLLQNMTRAFSCDWLMQMLQTEEVSRVYFDCAYFTDSATFRKISPHTKFIALSSLFEEARINMALCCGAKDFLMQPFSTDDFDEVYERTK
ncbi:hypothetical protein DWQ65_05445 [Treponema phagedenis]|uniref:Response regulatory domain-containing protein n=1 Tax=Treponema phagedenis TaxID=162 RepID=A0A0B7GVN6_TREPH|nr:hypothetical protein [Treponema phagedenis]EFW39391.1 hypothetical protein HMPREF9554_00084 [Treponema phagedenis F0421]NVP22992.1 hypothetical protein [Treponema phagedenis]QEJ95114.1 hypothetical protein FUT79_07815 [Treponema phagedenis]QEJ98212.1 hypothetical protein FUT82_09520 [Treponema phagedenis]QEK01039.1 hypothetical protein FUT84_07660 [Treponema phagedenis]